MSFFGNRRNEPDEEPIEAVLEDAENEDTQQIEPVPEPPKPPGFDSVLGVNAVLEGVLRSDANIRLDGQFKGTLEISGNVLVGDTAEIEADINARNTTVAGIVRGNLSGNRIHLLASARVWGDIAASRLIIEEGAFFQGSVTMRDHPAMLEEGHPINPAEGDLLR